MSITVFDLVARVLRKPVLARIASTSNQSWVTYTVSVLFLKHNFLIMFVIKMKEMIKHKVISKLYYYLQLTTAIWHFSELSHKLSVHCWVFLDIIFTVCTNFVESQENIPFYRVAPVEWSDMSSRRNWTCRSCVWESDSGLAAFFFLILGKWC